VTQRVGIHTDRAAVYNAARCNCIPTRRITAIKLRAFENYKPFSDTESILTMIDKKSVL
jgi:hypothetical protein